MENTNLVIEIDGSINILFNTPALKENYFFCNASLLKNIIDSYYDSISSPENTREIVLYSPQSIVHYHV